MFSGQKNNGTTSTNRILTLRYAVIMLVIALSVGYTSYYLIEAKLVGRDADQLTVLTNNMDRVYRANGSEKVLSVLERDRYFLRLSGYSASLWDENGGLLFREGVKLPVSVLEEQSDGSLTDRIMLGSWLLIMSFSSEQRQKELVSIRNVMLLTFLSLWLASILLVAHLNNKLLTPIRQLVEHVKHLQRAGLQEQLRLSASKNSELGELILLFNHQMGRIDQLITSLEDTLNAAAHDLRTPFTRLRLSAESALTKNTPKALRESLQDCLEENERVLSMVNSLLDVATLEQQLNDRDKEPTDLYLLITEASQLYEYLAEEKHIKLNIQLPETMPVFANPNRIRQAFANLFDNAIKFTPEHGTISVIAEGQDGQWLVKVEDSGEGIAPEDQPHIFNRLYRGDAGRHSPGFGLGLSIVRAIIESHGGSIGVSSEKASGTKFSCYLPRL